MKARYALGELKKVDIISTIQSALFDERGMKNRLKTALKNVCGQIYNLSRHDLAVTACRIASSKIVNHALNARKTHVASFVSELRRINKMSITFDSIDMFHLRGSEPWFYDSAYQKPNRSSIIVPIDDKGICYVNKITNYFEEGKSQGKASSWECNEECKPVSVKDKNLIKRLQAKLKSDSMKKVFKAVDSLDRDCSHGHYTSLRTGRDLRGHPLPCSSDNCFSELRTVRAASVHYDTVRKFLNCLYGLRKSYRFIKAIDDELSRSDYNALLMRMGFKEVDDLSPLFEDVDDKDVDVNLANSGLTDMQLELTYAQVINAWLKELGDDPEFPCCSCERLFRWKNVTKVDINDAKWSSSMWETLLSHITKQDKSDDTHYYVCSYCRNSLNGNKLPPCCFLNGLETTPIPPELASLDALSVQLIRRAKAFQTVIRLGTYTNKVPVYNSLQACKGTMFFLPLPVNKTTESIAKISDDSADVNTLADPELYFILN